MERGEISSRDFSSFICHRTFALLSLYDPSIQKEKLSFVWHLIGELHRPGDSPFLKGPWRTWSGPAADPGELLAHDIPPWDHLEDCWCCQFHKNINKFKLILQTVVVKFCRRLQKQKKWELPSVGAENFLIHGQFFMARCAGCG